MKRDMDLIRKILLWMEENDDHEIEIEGYSDDQVGHHCYLLMKAGLIEAADSSAMDSFAPTAIPLSITWAGHEFLDSAKDNKIWAAAKEKVIGPAGGVAFAVLLEWLKAEAKRRLGLPD